jgi:hypothetical protein
MPESDNTGISINPGYVLGQLSRAMVAAKEHPDEAARQRAVKPDRPKENFTRLRGYLNMCVESSARAHEGNALSRALGAAMHLLKCPAAARTPELTARDIGMIRHILHAYVSRHGDPGSEQFAQRRKEQAELAGLPTHDELGRVLLTRLERHPQATGIADLESVVSQVASDESIQFKIPVGWSIPESLVLKVSRCWEAPLEQLVEKGVVTSGDVLAEMLPQNVRFAAFRTGRAAPNHSGNKY